MTDEQRLIKAGREYYKKEKREFEMSTVKEKDFERRGRSHNKSKK